MTKALRNPGIGVASEGLCIISSNSASLSEPRRGCDAAKK